VNLAIDTPRAFAFSKWLLPPTLDLALGGSALADLDEDVTPLLCFVNRDSGGRRGKSLLESLR
jgi:hypothetical protein